MKSRSTATVLRLSALGVRSVFIIALARLLPVESVGQYGLLAATLTYLIYIVGIDFYTYANRELVAASSERAAGILASQLALAILLYAFVIPMSWLLVPLGVVSPDLWIWIAILIPLEHLGTEVNRSLVILQKNTAASIVLFIRQAAAPIATIAIMIWIPNSRSLSLVFTGWVTFSAAGLILGYLMLRRQYGQSIIIGVNWAWVRRGIRTSLMFLVGTLCLTGMFTLDRQVVSAFVDEELLGAYVLFMTIGAGISSILSAGVHQFTYPKLVTAAQNQDVVAFRRVALSMLLQTGIVLVAVCGTILMLLNPLLAFFDKEAYYSASWILQIVMIVISIYNLSLVPHFCLYALRADRFILVVTVAAAVIFASITTVFVRWNPVVGVLTGIGFASLVLLLSKSIATFWYSRRTWGVSED